MSTLKLPWHIANREKSTIDIRRRISILIGNVFKANIVRCVDTEVNELVFFIAPTTMQKNHFSFVSTESQSPFCHVCDRNKRLDHSTMDHLNQMRTFPFPHGRTTYVRYFFFLLHSFYIILLAKRC